MKSYSFKQHFHHNLHLYLNTTLYRFYWTFVSSAYKPNHKHVKACCQRYPSLKVHSVCFNINYTKGHRCCDINVSLSVLQQGLFVLLSGMLSIRQTRFMLLFRREAAVFCRASGMVFLHVCGSTWLCLSCRGQNGHSVTTDGQEKPGGGI